MTEQLAAAQPLTPAEKLAAEIDAAYAAEGYIKDGQRDHRAVAEAIYPLIAKAYIQRGTDRTAKAVTRGTIFTTAFPSLPRPEDWAELSDPELAEKVGTDIRAAVWNLCKSDKTGYVQQIVGVRTPGLVLCRTKLGTDRVDAAYVTDDLKCIKEDFVAPLSATMKAANRRMANNLSMVGARIPEYAGALDRLYRSANKTALNAGAEITRLMLESAQDEVDGEGDDGELE